MTLVFQAIFSLKMITQARRLATLLKPTTSFFSAKESAKPGNKTNITFLIQSLRREPSITSLQTIFGRLFRRLYSVNPNPGNTMVVTHNVKGYDEFSKKMEELENGNGSVHVLFSGGKDENGLSWCPYCVKAEPVIHDALKKAPENSHFVHVDVGERAYWKDLNCPFRKDPNTHLIFLPTLLRWKQPQRLDGERCSNKDLVEMMFEDED